MYSTPTAIASFKKVCLAITTSLLFCSTVFAQITVTNATFPTAGTTLRTAMASNPGIATNVVFTPPGGNQTWDLSGLQRGTVKTTVFKAASEGSQAANVPGAELVSTSSSSPQAETYYNVTSSRFETQATYDRFYDVVPLYLSKNGPPLPERYAPLNFFDIYQTNSFEEAGSNCIPVNEVGGVTIFECSFSPADFDPVLLFQLSLSAGNAEKYRYRVTKQRLDVVDAWGTMTVPGGTYNVLRVKRTEYTTVRFDGQSNLGGQFNPDGSNPTWVDITDQAISAGFQRLGTCTTYTTIFVNDVEKEPIAVVSSGCLGSDGDPFTASAVEYKLVSPLLSINNVTQTEGNNGTTNFNFTVSLTAPAPAGGVSFDIATANGTANPATEPSDYTAKSLTSQTIPAGTSTYDFTVAVNGDVDVEPDETFFVNVSNVTGAVLDDGQGLGTITNDDVAPPAEMTLAANGPTGTICGENVTVTIKVKDFADIGTLDFSVNWDPAKLELLSYTPEVIDDDAPLNGEFFADGQLTYTWYDSDLDYGVTLPDGTTILTLNFKTLVNSATGVAVDITGTPTAISASDLNFEEVTVVTENLVSFNVERVIVSDPTVTQPTCDVPTGTIVVNATGNGTLEYSVNGGTSWSSSNTFIGLAPGNYTVAARLQSNPTCIVNYSGNPVVLTAATGCNVVCPKSQGYWKNNPSAWPASALPMLLGTSNTYTKQQLRKILNTAVGTGTKADASLILAYQLIAAKLNIADGAIAPASVTSAIAAADAAIDTRSIPASIRTNTSLGKKMTSLAKTLESFNTGQLTAGCASLLTVSEIPTEIRGGLVSGQVELGQNYPNPASNVATIRYVVPVASTVSLSVYNSQGQQVAKLVDGRVQAGSHQVRIDASKLATGIYLYRLQSTDSDGQTVIMTRRMIISK